MYKDDASAEWTSTISTTTGYTIISSLTSGTFYNFKVAGFNKYG